MVGNKNQKGARHFLSQRISGFLILLSLIFVLGFLVPRLGLPFDEVRFFLRQPSSLVILGLVSLIVPWHAYLGIESILDDYIDSDRKRGILLLLLRLAAFSLAAAMLFSLITLQFQSY